MQPQCKVYLSCLSRDASVSTGGRHGCKNESLEMSRILISFWENLVISRLYVLETKCDLQLPVVRVLCELSSTSQENT